MRIRGILETIIYADDPVAAARFYRDLLGFAEVGEPDELSAGLRVGPERVLLIFNPTKSEVPGRIVPSHGARGPGHVAFLIEKGDYDAWLGRLADAGIGIEQEHVWGDRGRSIYFRDPAGNSVELVTRDIW